MISIAIDAMGGDYGEKPIIEGLIQALDSKKFKAVLVGDKNILDPKIPRHLKQFIEYEESSFVFPMEESATEALKYKESTL